MQGSFDAAPSPSDRGTAGPSCVACTPTLGTLRDVNVVDQLYFWTDRVLFWGLVALRVWALFDCLTRKAAAFPAVDKLTKPAWTAILLIAGLLGSLLSTGTDPSSVLNIFSLASVVAAAVYLADVRPAVREISNGR